MHELVLDLLRWARANNITQQAQTEMLALLEPYLRDNGANLPFPTTFRQAEANFSQFFKQLPIHHHEQCACGHHMFDRNANTAGMTCPVCDFPTRDERGKKTTCTFTKFALVDKLRVLFARPSFVPLLTSHHEHVPTPNSMRDIYGTYHPQYAPL